VRYGLQILQSGPEFYRMQTQSRLAVVSLLMDEYSLENALCVSHQCYTCRCTVYDRYWLFLCMLKVNVVSSTMLCTVQCCAVQCWTALSCTPLHHAMLHSIRSFTGSWLLVLLALVYMHISNVRCQMSLPLVVFAANLLL